jgi:16S rRNA (cytidine1402-2'-O)-methyltransferase
MSEGEGGRRGQLVLVATPIGNLGDLSARAGQVLEAADLICCEDTRRTRALLSAMGISASGQHGDRLLSLHGHNERARVQRVIDCVTGGGTVAVVSDAGMPGISDPGSVLVSEVASAGLTVTVVPGPTSVVASLVVSGLPTDRFCVEGFLPRKGAERRGRVAALMADQRTTVVLEAPPRVAATLSELAGVDPDRQVAVVRELTKVHEEVWRGTMAAAAAAFAERTVRGEVVLVVGGASLAPPATDAAVDDAVRHRLAQAPQEGPRQIADALAPELGVSRRDIYQVVLRIKGEHDTPA